MMPTLAYLLRIDESKYENAVMGPNLLGSTSGSGILASGDIMQAVDELEHVSQAFGIVDQHIRGNYNNRKWSDMRQDVDKKYQLFLIIMMFLPCLLVLNKNLQNDIWFLLNSGRYVLENGIPYVEPFTIHHGFDFVMQQWLSACIFWLTYINFGLFGLHILVLLCYCAVVLFLYKLCMIVSNGYFFISFCVTLLASLMLSTMMAGRPMVFSTLILVVVLFLLEKYKLSHSWKSLFPIPLLSVLMINSHAAIWPMLFIILTPYIIESSSFSVGTLVNKGSEKGPLIGTACLIFITGFINPYGFNAMIYFFKSYGSPEIRMVVEEMRNPNLNNFTGLVVIGSLIIVALIYTFFGKRGSKLRYVLLTLGTAGLAMMATRNFLFFAICGVFPIAYLLKDVHLPTRQQEVSNIKQPKLRMTLVGLIMFCLFASLLILPKSNLDSTNDTIKLDEIMLRETIQFILEEKFTSKTTLYTGYNDGGLAEFMGIPAYIDPRAEVFLKMNNQKEDILNEYCKLQSGMINNKDFLDKYQFTHLILTKYDILYTELNSNRDYIVIYSNKKYTLFEKKN